MRTLAAAFATITLTSGFTAHSANIVCQQQGTGQGVMIAYSQGQATQTCDGHCEFVAYGGPVILLDKRFTLYPNQNGIIVAIANTGSIFKTQNVTLNCSKP